jgi:UDP-MurNAc hydroxylase
VVDGLASWDDLLFSMRFSASRDPDVPNDHLLWLLRHGDRDALLSIEAYERSHDIVNAPGRDRSARGAEHFGEEDGEWFEEDDGERTAPTQPGTQVVPPTMR